MKEIEEFYNKLLKIKYGWHDKEGRLHPKIEPQIFAREYKMQPIIFRSLDIKSF